MSSAPTPGPAPTLPDCPSFPAWSATTKSPPARSTTPSASLCRIPAPASLRPLPIGPPPPATPTPYPWARVFASKPPSTSPRFSATNQVILNAMKKYGLIMADNGSSMYISGAPDDRWGNDDLHNLGKVTASDFEVIQISPLYTSANVPSGPSPQITPFIPSANSVAAGTPVTLSWQVTGASYIIVSPQSAPPAPLPSRSPPPPPRPTPFTPPTPSAKPPPPPRSQSTSQWSNTRIQTSASLHYFFSSVCTDGWPAPTRTGDCEARVALECVPTTAPSCAFYHSAVIFYSGILPI